ncbi:hypothetical protein [Phytohabitans flavus]|uniref:hypothetical protein n=1 Tax=Phytohabitans flavus TaxID=1076124 RepID=UPI0015669D68|nr:hypothetical protein [Phytohabitans flavus]
MLYRTELYACARGATPLTTTSKRRTHSASVATWDWAATRLADAAACWVARSSRRASHSASARWKASISA